MQDVSRPLWLVVFFFQGCASSTLYSNSFAYIIVLECACDANINEGVACGHLNYLFILMKVMKWDILMHSYACSKFCANRCFTDLYIHDTSLYKLAEGFVCLKNITMCWVIENILWEKILINQYRGTISTFGTCIVELKLLFIGICIAWRFIVAGAYQPQVLQVLVHPLSLSVQCKM